MVAGIVAILVVGVVGIALSSLASSMAFQNGYRKGMQYEANQWMEAFIKVKPPNWQSLPDPVGVTGEESVAQRKLYAEAYSRALNSVQIEMVINRVDALREEILKAIENA